MIFGSEIAVLFWEMGWWQGDPAPFCKYALSVQLKIVSSALCCIFFSWLCMAVHHL